MIITLHYFQMIYESAVSFAVPRFRDAQVSGETRPRFYTRTIRICVYQAFESGDCKEIKLQSKTVSNELRATR